MSSGHKVAVGSRSQSQETDVDLDMDMDCGSTIRSRIGCDIKLTLTLQGALSGSPVLMSAERSLLVAALVGSTAVRSAARQAPDLMGEPDWIIQ